MKRILYKFIKNICNLINPRKHEWDSFINAISMFSDDFMEFGRNDSK